ncbi:MAG: hypothetical protein M3R55_14720 [Acidobacteriota bacterium]|nr:hypothetical protein [Acidobacteriota bacterium]
MATKAEQIVDRFTKDPVVKKDILACIADVKSGKHPEDLDKTIARFTTDAVVAAKIKKIVTDIKAGKSFEAIAHEHHPDKSKAPRAAAKMHEHREAVTNIIKGKN